MSDLAISGNNGAGNTGLMVSDEDQLVTMTVDGQLFGIPILRVQDIVEPRQITPVPLATSAVAGVLNLRGRIVTVIDLRVCLGAPPTDLSTQPMSVTVENKGDLYTILVDSIGDVRSLPRRNLDKSPNTLDARMRRLCSGVYRLQDDLLAVLDVDRILDPATIADTPKRPPLKPGNKPARIERTTRKAVAAPKGDAKSAGKSEAKPEKAAAPEKVPELANPSKNASLFDRLGGELAIDAVVDMFYGKVMGDDRLTPFFDGVQMDHQASQMKAFLTQAFGGPANYRGRDMRSAHQRLVHQMELDDGHFIAVASHLADSLNQMGVPPELIDEVLAIVESVRRDVLDQ